MGLSEDVYLGEEGVRLWLPTSPESKSVQKRRMIKGNKYLHYVDIQS